MSTHAYAVPDYRVADDIGRGIVAARLPIAGSFLDGDTLTLTFTPDLTPAEAATLADIVASRNVRLTATEYAGIKDDLAVMRAFRQRSQSEFMALTANQRDRELFDLGNAVINVLRALTRD